jgi:hypothetical protein
VGGEGLGEELPVGVGVGERGALNGLGGLREGDGLPIRDGHWAFEERGGAVDGVGELGGGAPALGGSLLE